MDQISSIFNNIFEASRKIWEKLSFVQKIAMGIAFLFIGGGLMTLMLLQERSTMRYLFVDLTSKDVAEVTRYLQGSGFDEYVIDAKGIKVPVEQLATLRIKLSQEGLPEKGVVGWEAFDEEDFSRTQFEQEIQRLRAVQGELSRTIAAIDGIQSARVHIVLPKISLFVREEKEPTAAVYIRTRRNAGIDRKQVKGIQHLVSNSVEGLKPTNITIIDSDGRMLTEIESRDPGTKQTQDLLEFKKSIESGMEERIRAIVGRVVGPDRVEAKVDADIDFTRETQRIVDVDPDDVAVLSKNSSGMTMSGEGLNPTGIPGSKSNVPGEQEQLAASGSKAGSEKSTELLNYEVSKTVSQKTLQLGTINRLTVSVIVDGKQIYPIDGSTPAFEERSPEEMLKIRKLIEGAVGYKEVRGDVITVENMMFQLDPFQMMELSKIKQEDREYLSTLAVSASSALALVLFFVFIVRPYFRWLSYDPERKEAQAIVEEYKPDLELGSIQNVQIQEDVPFDKLSPQEQVLFLARNEPKRTTEAIRMLLNPNQ
ncbi:MAG: flagellar basal-body MS-ring/collar protein FliF [Oligoflexales bacterium]